MNTQVGAYEYRVFGSFNDVSARSFYTTQTDLAYRKTWDESVLLIDVLDAGKEKQNQKGEPLEPLASELEGTAIQPAQVQPNAEADGTPNQSELIRWVTQYPFPLPSREYLYRRRQFYDKEKNFFFVLSRSVSNADVDADGESAGSHKVSSSKSSRSQHYKSALVVLPHAANIDEHGCDYFLSYVDDPQAGVPVRFANWCAATNLSKCHRRVHEATIKLEQQLVATAAQKLIEESAQQQTELQTEDQTGKLEPLSDQSAPESQSIPLASSEVPPADDSLSPHLKYEPKSVKFIDGLIAKWLAFQRSETTRESLHVNQSTGPGRETESEETPVNASKTS